MLKIYFCGSIRGGRELAARYRRAIECLQDYGLVLTAHVGDPSLTVQGGDGMDAEIWQRDTQWLRDCHVLIAECSQPSLGVGYEVACGVMLGKPVHVFYGGEAGRLSAMLAGDPAITVHHYDSEASLLAELRCVMETIRQGAR